MKVNLSSDFFNLKQFHKTTGPVWDSPDTKCLFLRWMDGLASRHITGLNVAGVGQGCLLNGCFKPSNVTGAVSANTKWAMVVNQRVTFRFDLSDLFTARSWSDPTNKGNEKYLFATYVLQSWHQPLTECYDFFNGFCRSHNTVFKEKSIDNICAPNGLVIWISVTALTLCIPLSRHLVQQVSERWTPAHWVTGRCQRKSFQSGRSVLIVNSY